MAKKDYSKLEKEELLKIIEKLETRKKYGLVWDEERTKEQFEKESENALPVLKEVKSKEIKTDPKKPTNILIEGDNYHALSVLNYTHQGKIDVIYIDPPYNTGAKDWKYNNDFVDKNDTWRHSKWLSFMNKRLILAKRLLSDDGVLICTIDDNEAFNLGVLRQGIFGDKEITCVTIVHNPSGVQGINFSRNNEYAYFVHKKNKKVIAFETREDEDADTRPFINGAKGNTKSYLRESGYNSFYPILVKNDEIIGFGDVCDKNYHPNSPNLKRKDGVIEIYPIDKDGVERKWLFSRNSVDEILEELFLKKNGKDGLISVHRTKKNINYKTVWSGSKFNAKTYGTQLIQEIIKTEFSFPKSLYAVEECLKAVVHDKDKSFILDFFAGSGTTAHAVLDLNKKDGGNRQFILCTNNENNIATEICYPRVQKVINGYKNKKGEKIEGLGGNLKYFKTAFVKNSISRDDLKLRITRECTEMLCLREGIFDEVKAKPDYHIFEQNGRIMAVYYALEQNGLEQLKKELDKMKGEKILYCFTLDPLGLDKEDFVDWQGVSLESIPQPILDIYKEIYNL